MPEAEALGAVRSLREQVRITKAKIKQRYPGRRSGIDPVAFLMENYGDDIRAKRMTSGRLAQRDSTLYNAVCEALGSTKSGVGLGEFFDTLLPESLRGGVVELRVTAAAKILDVDPQRAAKFFGTLTSARVRPEWAARETGQSSRSDR